MSRVVPGETPGRFRRRVSHSLTPTTTMQIKTYRHKGIDRGVALYDVPPGSLEEAGDVVEEITGSRPWEAEDGTLSVECHSSRRASALKAYLEVYFGTS